MSELRAASMSAGMNACSSPRPWTTSASARWSLVTKLGLHGNLVGVLAAVGDGHDRDAVAADLSGRCPPTSGVEATTRRVAEAGPATSPTATTASTARTRWRRRDSALGEAMAVTPDEGGPLDREALVGRLVAPAVVELEAQTLELRGLPGHEGGPGLGAIDRAIDRLGVVEARSDGVAGGRSRPRRTCSRPARLSAGPVDDDAVVVPERER